MNSTDTICAISTPAGVGGIAVLRLSGTDAKQLAEASLQSASGRAVRLADHKATFAHLHTNEGFLDEVVATLFAAPHSYTGETVVELSCHGSLYVQQRMLQHFIGRGARLAEPGEFTLRAFLNRRLDLSQAEAVADLIDARSQSAHRLAVSQMRGGYAQELESLRKRLIDLAALLELELDFSDEEVEFANRKALRQTTDELRTRVAQLVGTFQSGNALKHGVPVAIVGRPNVGKSTLLNALLNEERAIVSDQAGTTRDTVEELFTIDGIQFRLIDTAGIRHTENSVEQAGIERSRKAAEQAMVVLYVVEENDDASAVTQAIEDMKATFSLDDKRLMVVRNKCDRQTTSTAVGSMLGPWPVVSLSAKYGTGLDDLRKQMVAAATQGIGQQDVLLTNARHYEALNHVLEALGEVLQGMEVDLPSDLLVVDIRDALYHLGTITGKVTPDDILSTIFSRFCIGK